MLDRYKKWARTLWSETIMLFWFFYRSLVRQLSFRSWFAMRIIGMVISITTFAIFAKVVPAESVQTDVLQRYGIGGEHPMVTWFLIGMLIQNMVALGRAGISSLVNSRYYPYYHSSPTHLVTILIGNRSFSYLWAVIETIAYLAVGTIYGMTIHFNPAFLLILLTGMILIFSLDLLSAGWNIVTKTGKDPLNWFLSLFSGLVSGRMIPVWLLPGWIQAISYIHPQYYINELARHTLGGNATIKEITPQLGPLIILTIIILIAGYHSFKYGFRKARKEGTLGHSTN